MIYKLNFYYYVNQKKLTILIYHILEINLRNKRRKFYKAIILQIVYKVIEIVVKSCEYIQNYFRII